MSSCKDVKKDVKSILENVIQECYLNLQYSPGLNQENTLDIIADVLEYKHEILDKVNHYPKNASKKEIKLYFSQIIDDLLKNSVEFVDRLN